MDADADARDPRGAEAAVPDGAERESEDVASPAPGSGSAAALASEPSDTVTTSTATIVREDPSVPFIARAADSKERYRRNEAYIDVIENVHAQLDAQGRDLGQSWVEGRIIFKLFLSGYPRCTLGVNCDLTEEPGDKGRRIRDTAVHLDEVVLHPCVDRAKFEETGGLHFVPPPTDPRARSADKEFVLIKYAVSGVEGPLPLVPRATIEEPSPGLALVTVELEDTVPKKMMKNVTIRVPCPGPLGKAKIKATKGKAQLQDGALVWVLAKYKGTGQGGSAKPPQVIASIPCDPGLCGRVFRQVTDRDV